MGMTIPIPTMVEVSPNMFPKQQVKIEEVDEDESSSESVDIIKEATTKGGDEEWETMVMSKGQQAFSAGSMGVAGIYAQKLVKETIESATKQYQTDETPVVMEPRHHHAAVDSDH